MERWKLIYLAYWTPLCTLWGGWKNRKRPRKWNEEKKMNFFFSLVQWNICETLRRCRCIWKMCRLTHFLFQIDQIESKEEIDQRNERPNVSFAFFFLLSDESNDVGVFFLFILFLLSFVNFILPVVTIHYKR